MIKKGKKEIESRRKEEMGRERRRGRSIDVDVQNRAGEGK